VDRLDIVKILDKERKLAYGNEALSSGSYLDHRLIWAAIKPKIFMRNVEINDVFLVSRPLRGRLYGFHKVVEAIVELNLHLSLPFLLL
jgi:hypothetical protein